MSNKLDLLPADLPPDFAEEFTDWAASQVTNKVELLRFMACDVMVKAIDKFRKKRNSELSQLTKLWDARRKQLVHQVVDIIEREGRLGDDASGPGELYSNQVGVVFKSSTRESISVPDSDPEVATWLLGKILNDPDYDRSLPGVINDLESRRLVEVTWKLTREGKEQVRSIAREVQSRHRHDCERLANSAAECSCGVAEEVPPSVIFKGKRQNFTHKPHTGARAQLDLTQLIAFFTDNPPEPVEDYDVLADMDWGDFQDRLERD